MIGGLILIISSIFALLAAIGLLRMPDLFTKMHAASKAGAFSGSMLLVLAAIVFGPSYIPLVIVNIIFFYFTAPIAVQVIAKAALDKDLEIWEKSDK
jgi:multicomponent Na+:H+ antiporter subunit G